MIENLLSMNHIWRIIVYLGLSAVMILKMVSYYLGYRILKSWRKEQKNTQDLIRKTAYCIFATQIVMLVLGILLRIAAGNSLLDGGLIELDWILAGLFLLCIPQIKTKEKSTSDNV